MHTLSNKEIKELADKWLKGTITEQEQVILDNWYKQQPDDHTSWPDQVSEDRLKQRMFANIEDAVKEPSLVRHVGIWKAAAAAMVLVFIGIALFYRVGNNATEKLTVKNNFKVQHDYTANNTHKVMLTLANGSQVVLNRSDKNMVLRNGNTLIQEDGEGAFIHSTQPTQLSGGAPQLNMVSTPSGEKFGITLPDGTRVWLNALSSLKFPAAFNGSTRMVELDGEAYFEVAKDKSKPFIVNTPQGAAIKVLGTHFNVMAYNDEHGVNATLLEGSVNVIKGSVSKLITPGQQAAIGQNIKVTEVDAQQAIAWKNDLFSFDGAGTHQIMRQIGRWYGVKIIYSSTTRDRQLTGYVSRRSKLADVLKMLELSGMDLLIKNDVIEVLN